MSKGARDARVAIVEGARWGIGVHGAVHIVQEVRHRERGAAVVDILGPEERLPSNACIDGEVRRGVKGVLNIKRWDGHAGSGLLGQTLAKAAHGAGEKVEHGVAGSDAVKREATVLEIAGKNIVLGTDVIDAKSKMVLTSNPIHVIGELVGIDIQVGRRACSATDIEARVGDA